MTTPTPREIVFEALNNAVANEYDCSDLTAHELAEDLRACCAACEGMAQDDVVSHVEAWRAAQGRAEEETK